MINFIKKQSAINAIKVIAIILVICAMAVAEDTINVVSQKEVLTQLDVRMNKEISIDFVEMPIGDVIAGIADQADVDIIISPEVVGLVTAKLTNVPLSEALTNILSAHGYGYVKSENMIRVVPLAQMTTMTERLVSRVYRITYADSTEVERALEKFLSDRGSISSNPGTSNIIITDTESKIKAIDTFIEEIDRIIPQIMIEVRIYDVTHTDDFDLGIAWNVGANHTEWGAASPDSTDHGVAKKTYPSSSAGDNAKTRLDNKIYAAGSFDQTVGGAIRLGFLGEAVDIDISLNMLHKQVGAKLLANPRIMVLDNNTALFKIVREFAYDESQDTTGGGIVTSTEFKEVGIELEVTPHVTKDDLIKLHLIPEFGVVADATTSPPTVDTRMLDTVVLIKNNQTVVLGGLRKREVTQTVSKTPFFGDLPLLGDLFRDDSDNVVTNELIVFITPRIIIKPTLTPQEAEVLEKTNAPAAKMPESKFEYAIPE
jgi:type IV pilus assembly protein PilQ